MATFNLLNFSIAGVQAVLVTAAITSARIKLPVSDGPDVMIVNQGLTAVYVRAGDVTVVADANAMPVLPGEKGVYSVGRTDPPATHLAYATLSGTQDIQIVRGQGS